MALSFYKYHGTGNDFIICDERIVRHISGLKNQADVINNLCNRQFGIGADGLILIQNAENAHFKMVYFNADGLEGSMCGNGSRCAVAYFKSTGFAGNQLQFQAIDGLHHAKILADKGIEKVISVQLSDTIYHSANNDPFQINTGSPHLILFTDNLADTDVVQQGRRYRYDKQFGEQGINVNFVETEGMDTLHVRTYERGVENETLSCGTGVTASAMGAWHANTRNEKNTYTVNTRGGQLHVSFDPPDENKNKFTDVWLTGPTVNVFKGEV